jgi:hypothetical protein
MPVASQNPYAPNLSLGQYANAGNGISGQLFQGGNQAVVATALSAGLPTTYTGGLVLANPPTSTVNVRLQKATAIFIIAQTNVSVIGLGIGFSATALTGTLTAVASLPGNPGSSAVAQGLLYSSASITLPAAPYLTRVIGLAETGAVTTGVATGGLSLDLQGSIILPPGGYAVFTSSAAGTASSFIGSFVWVEA